MPKEGSPIPAGIKRMRSAGFVYLGLDKLLLPTARTFSRPMFSFPELQQAKKPHKMEKQKAWRRHISREHHHSVHREKCLLMEANLALAQLVSSCAHSLPVVAGCPNRIISTVPRNATQLEVDWGCPCHRTAKELRQSCMGRKWASCYGNTVGGVGADMPFSRTFSPSALPTPGSISC